MILSSLHSSSTTPLSQSSFFFQIRNKETASRFFPRGFTLLELLLVIGILGIMGGITVVVINPQELLAEARDTTRLADLKSLNTALFTYTTQKGEPGGNSNYVYISLPDNPTCNTFLASLPTLPFPYEYRCSTVTDYRKIDGTGWIPVSFSSIPGGSPIATLPVDPENDVPHYYTYVSGGSYELTALFEAKKHDAAINDRGLLPGVLELGTHLGLTPLTRDQGLVGYWSFDEGSGSTAYDYSGNGNDGTLVNGPTWESFSCASGECLDFDGVDDAVNVGSSGRLDLTNGLTVLAWVRFDNVADITRVGNIIGNYGINPHFNFEGYTWGRIRFYWNEGETNLYSTKDLRGGWHHAVAVRDKISDTITLYIDGIFEAQASAGTNKDILWPLRVGNDFRGAPGIPFNGLIDDIRVYNRALSQEEVKVVYETTTK